MDPGRLDCDDPAGVPAPSGRVPVVVVRARDPRSGKQWRTSMRTQAKSLQIQFLKTGKRVASLATQRRECDLPLTAGHVKVRSSILSKKEAE